jgi:amino acid permease
MNLMANPPIERDWIQVFLIILFIIAGLIYDWGGVIGHPGPGLSNIRDGAFTGGFSGTAQSFTVSQSGCIHV